MGSNNNNCIIRITPIINQCMRTKIIKLISELYVILWSVPIHLINIGMQMDNKDEWKIF